MSWHLGPLASFDTETTGIDVFADRIVTAALIRPTGELVTWLSDVDGEEIPEGAARIHGVTTEHARAHGHPAKEVTEEIANAVAGDLDAGGAALVVMNAPFDLSLLDAECARYGVPTVAERIGRPVSPVVDPLVLDRAADKYRKGRRNLEAVAAHYGVRLTDAHTADADARATLDVALAIAAKYPDLQVPGEQLHGRQVTWHAQWAAGYQSHLNARSRGGTTAVIDGSWPVRPEPAAEEVAAP